MTQAIRNPAIVDLNKDEQKLVKGGETSRPSIGSDGDGYMSMSDDHPFRQQADEDQSFMSVNDDHI